MRKVTRKAFRENVAIFKRDAKRFELGMFDVKENNLASSTLNINGCLYVGFDNLTTIRSGAFFNFKCEL